jgi:hypothetical protein
MRSTPRYGGGRTMARVDAEFADGLVVEVAGHGTHATRLERVGLTQVSLRRCRGCTGRGRGGSTIALGSARSPPV